MRSIFIISLIAFAGMCLADDVVPVTIQGKTPSMTDPQALVDFGSYTPRRPLPTTFGKTGSNLLWDERGRIKLDALASESGFRRFLESSIDELKKYTLEFGDDANAWTVLGVRYYQTNNLSASIEAIAMARMMNPDHERSAELYSGLLVISGNLEKAAAEGAAMIDRLPENTVIRFNLACALARLGRTKEAMYHLEFLANFEWGDLIYYLNDRDLDALRSSAEFQAMEDTLFNDARTWVVTQLKEQI